MQIPQINIEDFNYFLPEERIAQFPLEKRDESKLLFANCTSREIYHSNFFNLSDFIPTDSLLIRNVTKVFPARIFMKKPTGGDVEVLFESPISFAVPQIALTSTSGQIWHCTVRGKNLNENLILHQEYIAENGENLILNGKIVEVVSGKRNIEFTWEPKNLSLAEFLSKIGKTPLPPYIKRTAEEKDKSTYQTVYAKENGSIAAPTAGLHFTSDVIEKLERKGIRIAELTLHVGSGTFMPMKASIVAEHIMHSEQFSFTLDFLKELRSFLEFNENNSQKKRIIATGTTSVRTLETIYWLGCKIFLSGNLESNHFEQWDWCDLSEKCELKPSESLSYLIEFIERNNSKFNNTFSGTTSLFIVPGYDFKIINGIITNFHLPKSTLLLLVAAFAGSEFYKEIYKNAIENNYRFLSYGDSSILFK